MSVNESLDKIVSLARSDDPDAVRSLFTQFRGVGRKLSIHARDFGYYSLEDADAATMAGIALALNEYDPKKGSFHTILTDKVRALVQEDIKVRTHKSMRAIRGAKGEGSKHMTSLKTVELDAPISGNDDRKRGDFLASPFDIDPERVYIKKEEPERSEQLKTAVRQCMRRLEPNERELFEKVHLQHVSQSQISRETGIPQGMISKRLSRIRAKLADMMRNDGLEY